MLGQEMKFTSSQWIAWMGATIAASLTLSSFAFTYFESKADALVKRQSVETSLQIISADVKDILRKMPRER